MIQVLDSYIVSAILIACVFAVSLLLGLALGRKSRRTRLLLNLMGVLLMAVAALEKIGWTVRPWSIGSPAEAWNDLSFRVVFLFGLGLLIVSWTMAFLRARLQKAERRRGALLDNRIPELELGVPTVQPGGSDRGAKR